MAETLLKLFIILTLIKNNKAIVGFNCGSADPAVKTCSLADAGECDFHEENLQVFNTTIELLQLAEFKTNYVIQYKIEISRTIYHCAMFSHLCPVDNGLQEYLYDISAEQYKFIRNTGIFTYHNFQTIANININVTKTVRIDLAGKTEEKSCSGGTNADDYRNWDNILVQGLVKITIMEEYTKVNLNNNDEMLVRMR